MNVRKLSLLILTLLSFVSMLAPAQDSTRNGLPPYVVTIGANDAYPIFSDEELWNRGIAIKFAVNKSNIDPDDPGYRSLVTTLRHLPKDITSYHLLVLRGSASPDGPAKNNARLARRRINALVDSLNRYIPLSTDMMEERTVGEDYRGLERLMRHSDFKYKDEVRAIIIGAPDNKTAKRNLQNFEGGKVWKELASKYFPSLRATRVVVLATRDTTLDATVTPTVAKSDTTFTTIDTIFTTIVDTVAEPIKIPEPTEELTPTKETITAEGAKQPRRELWAIKTNLLLDAAWVPQYGWCPMPNIEIEYYPRRGHWTFGGTFDMPWWQSSAYNSHTTKSTGKNHKFFQMRNYQLLARWYSHDGCGDDGFHGFYLQPYAGLTVYGIGFNAHKGWMGEGGGAGLGMGYKLPLGKLHGSDGHRTRASHWHMEFGLQVGAFYTRYDPYRYGNPITGEDDGYYYYNYKGSPSLFKKRNHSRWYFGPTRIAITIGYDIFYRSRKSRN